MFTRLGLRTEIVLQLTLLMAASIIFVSVLIMKVSEQELLQQRIQHNTSLLNLLTINLELKNRPQKEIELQLQQVLQHFHPKLGMKAIAVLASNKPISQVTTEEISNWPDVKESDIVRFSGSISTKLHYRGFLQTIFDPSQSYLLVTLPINNSYNNPVFLQAYFSLDDISSLAYQTHGYLIPYIFLVGLTLVLFGSHLLGKIVVQPIKALQQASINIASGDLQQSVPTSGPKEIYQLSDHFNRMSQALHASQNETETHIQSLKQINHELEQTRDELVQAEKMAAIGHLAAGIAHEIGNPLGALIGYLGLLRGQGESVNSPQSQDILSRSLKEAERIDQLVRDLLDYAHPEDEASTSCEPIKVIKDTLLMLNQQKSLSSGRLLLHLPASLPNVPLTHRKLQQVLINLLINARDASPKDENIILTAETGGSQIKVTVADKGEGISASLLPYLFDPFFTTKAHGKGRGLGLFIAHRIISDAGGKLEVESESNQGARFIILLPITESGADET